MLVIDQVISNAQSALWSDLEVRKKIENAGVKITPCNFYSSIPSIDEIEESFEYLNESPPYLQHSCFQENESTKLLEELTFYSAEFLPPVQGNEDSPEGFFWNNSQFSYSDAMSYYAFIRHFRPKTIIEIGSGFSTLVALEAAKFDAKKIVCIEPFPRKFMLNIAEITLIQKKAQDISAEWLNSNLQDGDILFIDSTHTVKSGSDCLHIYLRLIPKIKKRIIIHCHDVFLPFALPKDWLLNHHIYWTEQYLLLAFLTDNPKVTFLFGSAYHKWKNYDLLERFMHGQKLPGGGSFWFAYDGTK